MAYTKPGVEVRQVQRTSTPVLTAPELQAVVIGVGYKWYEPDANNEAVVLNQTYNPASSLQFAISDIIGAGQSVLPNSIVIDLISSGTVKHCVPTVDFSYNSGDGNVTISGGVTSGNATIVVGCLATISGVWNNFYLIESTSDLVNLVGDIKSWNPLAFGADLAMTHAGGAVNIIPIESDESTDHSAARDILELKDVYAIAPLSQTNAAGYLSHVTTMSQPQNKKERILFNAPSFNFTASKSDDAASLQSVSAAYGEKRLFNIYPTAGYVRETRHISTCRQSFIQAVFGNSFTLLPQFASKYTLTNATYRVGDTVTAEAITNLSADGVTLVDVFSPVPGYYYGAIVAGQVSGKEPQTPLTNLPISGITKTYRSQDYFSESLLNTIASGGTYIFTQNSDAAPLYCRHQLSTDSSSVAKRELSVTTQIDYAAKFFRSSVSPYIGRYVISDSFIDLVFTTLNGAGFYMRRNGFIRDFKVASVVQDTISPDTVLAEIEVLPLFPANYIKITLVF